MTENNLAVTIDCQFAVKSMKGPDGVIFEVSEPVCQHENFPWVEFPRGSGFHDPYYCRVALECGECPLGKVIPDA